MISYHWMMDADRVYEGHYLGECENGNLWVPSRRDPEKWARFDVLRLRHLRIYWRSKRAGRVVWLESVR